MSILYTEKYDHSYPKPYKSKFFKTFFIKFLCEFRILQKIQTRYNTHRCKMSYVLIFLTVQTLFPQIEAINAAVSLTSLCISVLL